MSQGKNILKSTMIYAVGNFTSKLLMFLLLPLYSFYISKEEFGIYDLILATITLLVPLITVQTSDSTYRWLLDIKDSTAERSKVITNGFLIILIISVLFYLAYFTISYFIYYKYKSLFAILLIFSCFLPFFQQITRGLGKSKMFVLAGIVNTILIIIFNVLFLIYFEFKLEGLLLATILSNAGTIVFLIIIAKQYKFFNFHNIEYGIIKSMINYSWPLVPNSISWWLINVADKYLILYFLSIEANGIYAMSTRFPALINIVNSIFLMAWQDFGINTQNDEKNRAFFSKMFNVFIILELCFVILLIPMSQLLIKYTIDVEYYESWKVLPFLFIGVAFSAFSAYIGVGYQRAKKTKNIFTTTLIGGVINILITVGLINKIGLFAPAIGTIFSSLGVYMIRKNQTNKFFKIDVNNKMLILLTSLAFIFSGLVLFFNMIVLNVFLIFCASVLFIYLNYNFLKKSLGFLMLIIKK